MWGSYSNDPADLGRFGVLPSNRYVYECPACDATFYHADGLQDHYDNDYCGFHRNVQFRNQSDTNQHFDYHHHCTTCNYHAQNHEELLRHKENRHPHCEPCDRTFVGRSQLDAHLASAEHTPKDFRCAFSCGAMFVSASAMVLHLEADTCKTPDAEQKIACIMASFDRYCRTIVSHSQTIPRSTYQSFSRASTHTDSWSRHPSPTARSVSARSLASRTSEITSLPPVIRIDPPRNIVPTSIKSSCMGVPVVARSSTNSAPFSSTSSLELAAPVYVQIFSDLWLDSSTAFNPAVSPTPQPEGVPVQAWLGLLTIA
jgi:hypothetical protein